MLGKKFREDFRKNLVYKFIDKIGGTNMGENPVCGGEIEEKFKNKFVENPVCRVNFMYKSCI